MTRAEMAEEIAKRDRLLEAVRAERDRYERALRWALGEGADLVGEQFPVKREGDPPYYWRRRLRILAFGGKSNG